MIKGQGLFVVAQTNEKEPFPLMILDIFKLYLGGSKIHLFAVSKKQKNLPEK